MDGSLCCVRSCSTQLEKRLCTLHHTFYIRTANANILLLSYIFGIANVITIPMVWALYPETNQRTLEVQTLLLQHGSSFA
jgi:hypothetical protein